MRKINLLCIIVLTGMLSSSIAMSEEIDPALGKEIVHSIFEFDIEYQERARSIVAEMMYHWHETAYVRWRPVRIVPRELLQEKLLSSDAMPESIRLTIFPDSIVNARKTDYFYDEATGGAIWTGVMPGSELSQVRISIVDMTDKFTKSEERIAFVIKVWNPPKHYAILPTDDLDVYVAIEGRAFNDTNVEWAPNN